MDKNGYCDGLYSLTAGGWRAMQQTDLRLENYRYELMVEDVKHNNYGEVMVSLVEHSIQNFAQHPDIDSELFNIPPYLCP